MASQQESETIPLKILVDKQRNKVIFVEATKDFVDTLQFLISSTRHHRSPFSHH